MNIEERNKVFIDRDKLFSLIEGKTPTQNEVNEILNKALKLQGLNLEEVAICAVLVSAVIGLDWIDDRHLGRVVSAMYHQFLECFLACFHIDLAFLKSQAQGNASAAAR